MEQDSSSSSTFLHSTLCDELQRGRCERKMLRKKAKRRGEPMSDQCYIKKILYPAARKYGPCQHSDNFIFNREILDRQRHLQLLATPVKGPAYRPPELVFSKPLPLTNRTAGLAKPKRQHVESTIERYSDRLTSKQRTHLDRLRQPNGFVSIDESLAYAKRQRIDDAIWRQHRERTRTKILRRIHGLELRLIDDIVAKAARHLRQFYEAPATITLQDEPKRIAAAIMASVCQLLRVYAPPTDSEDEVDKFFLQFADKVAYWIWILMGVAGISLDTEEIHVASVIEPVTPDGGQVRYDDEEAKDISLDLVNDCVQAAVSSAEGVGSDPESEGNDSDPEMEENVTEPEEETPEPQPQ